MSKYWKDVRRSIKKILKDPNVKSAKFAYKGDKANSQNDWHKLRNPLRMLFTALIFEILRKTPPNKLKNLIYRIFGVKIGKDVSIAYNVLPDPLFPELLTIEDGVMIGSDCELATHEFVRDWFALGRTVLKKNAMISGYTLIRAGVTIGENSLTGAMCFVTKDVEKNTFVGGVPAKPIKKMDPEDRMKNDIEITKYD
jgi:acetyltransferase-like isoleucine patch superfamily enzyme